MDNQGVGGCLDEGCTTIVVSDASGPLPDQDRPATGSIGVLGRAASILADRVREEQVRALAKYPDVRLVFIHLRQDLPPTVVRLRHGTPDPEWHPATNEPVPGVDPRVQEALARVRTDLDAFTELESSTLAALGWTLAGRAIPDLKQSPYAWDFLRAHRVLAAPTAVELRQLRAARHRMFRLFRMVPGLALAVVLPLVVGLGWLLWSMAPEMRDRLARPVPLWSLLLWVVIVAVVAGPPVIRALGRGGESNRWVDLGRRVVVQLAVAVTVAPLAWMHRRVVRPVVLWLGAVRE